MLVSHIQNVICLSRKKEKVYHLDYINKHQQYFFPNVRQPPYWIIKRQFYKACVPQDEVLARQYAPGI